MDTLAIHAVMLQAWTDEWSHLEAELAQELSPASSGRVLTPLLETVRQVAVAGFQAWLLRHEHAESTLVHDGQKLRFKRTDPKKFRTPLGPVTVERRVFPHDLGGPTFVPIDAAWGMGGPTATPEVREAAAFAMGLMTAAEAAQLLAEVALVRLGETSLKKLADQVGDWFETHPETVVAVREAEAIPEETQVLWASLDGTNVRLNEPGPKPGRPAAGDDGELAPTCFENAMVGTVSCYGQATLKSAGPERLQTRCVARMPEEKSPTFHAEFEAEGAATVARCDPTVTKVLVLDAAKGLWHYVASRPLCAGFEKSVDFYHAAEHLSTASEALFGKGTARAQEWAAKHRTLLLSDDGAARRVARAIRSAARRPLPAWARKEAATQRRFFAQHADRMAYASFRARGLPIGSGPVEAAGKTLVKQRLGRSGMRWTREGGQHVLTIRTLINSTALVWL